MKDTDADVTILATNFCQILPERAVNEAVKTLSGRIRHTVICNVATGIRTSALIYNELGCDGDSVVT